MFFFQYTEMEEEFQQKNRNLLLIHFLGRKRAGIGKPDCDAEDIFRNSSRNFPVHPQRQFFCDGKSKTGRSPAARFIRLVKTLKNHRNVNLLRMRHLVANGEEDLIFGGAQGNFDLFFAVLHGIFQHVLDDAAECRGISKHIHALFWNQDFRLYSKLCPVLIVRKYGFL